MGGLSIRRWKSTVKSLSEIGGKMLREL